MYDPLSMVVGGYKVGRQDNLGEREINTFVDNSLGYHVGSVLYWNISIE